MKKTLSFASLFFLVLFVISCSKDKNPPVDVTVNTGLTASLAGFGSHGGTPSGVTYVLPNNIKVIGEIYGGFPGKSGFVGKKTVEAWQNYIANAPKSNYITHGIGQYVDLYMKLYNTSSNASSFVFPAGLVFCNKSLNDSTVIDTTQSGIVIIPDTVTIPGGDTLLLCLKSFCSNLNFHAPNANSIYTYKVVSNNDQMNRFIAALKGKISLAAHVGDIQSYVWKITNNTGLTAEDYAIISTWQ